MNLYNENIVFINTLDFLVYFLLGFRWLPRINKYYYQEFLCDVHIPNSSFYIFSFNCNCQLLKMWQIYDYCVLTSIIKFIYSEKAQTLCEISTLDLFYLVTVKSRVKITQNFVAFSEYMNFTSKNMRAIFTRNWWLAKFVLFVTSQLFQWSWQASECDAKIPEG